MATKIRSKGTAALISISSVYTAIANIKSVSLSGEKSMTYDSTVLGGPSFKTKDPTGFSEPCSIAIEKFWDPVDTVDVLLKTLCKTPVATNVKITYADAAPTSEVYSVTGFGMDKSAAIDDGLSATITLETSGDPA